MEKVKNSNSKKSPETITLCNLYRNSINGIDYSNFFFIESRKIFKFNILLKILKSATASGVVFIFF